MKEGRRGFLKKLGIVAAAAPMAAIPAMAAPVVPTETMQAFRYQCDCGHEVVAPVPEVGTMLKLTCASCGEQKLMLWTGKGWNVRSAVAKPDAPPTELEKMVAARDGVSGINNIVPKKYWISENVIGTPFFTGWKGSENSPGYVGQWILYTAKGGPYFYVNLPGMQGGRYEKGQIFDISGGRVEDSISKKEMVGLLEAGLKKIRNIAKAHSSNV